MNKHINFDPEADPGDGRRDEPGARRMRFQDIVEAAGREGDAPAARGGLAADREDPPIRAIPAGPPQRNWNAASRQVWQASRLGAILIFFAIAGGWPVGAYLSHVDRFGTASGWLDTVRVTMNPGIVFFAVFVPVMILICGYLLSHVYKMLNAAQSITGAAREFIHPDYSAAYNAETVGLAVRGQMQALNSGIDDALHRLATVEAMIRNHVEAIETAGQTIETRASGAVDRVASERSRLIELTENLNLQADAFAAAIAQRAQASVQALGAADDQSSKAEMILEERLNRLEASAGRALKSFDALSAALGAADGTLRDAATSMETSAGQARAAGESAAEASSAAAERISNETRDLGDKAVAATAEQAEKIRTATNHAVESLAEAARASSAEAAKTFGELAEGALSEAKALSTKTVEATASEGARIREATEKALSEVRSAAESAVAGAGADVAKASEAADRLTETSARTAAAASKAADDLVKARDAIEKGAEETNARAEKAAARIGERSAALAEARAALETENARLETLIEEQRNRADRLADAIAAQTERLAKLADAQLREQEGSPALHGTQAGAAAGPGERAVPSGMERPATDETPPARPGRRKGAQASQPQSPDAPAKDPASAGALAAAPAQGGSPREKSGPNKAASAEHKEATSQGAAATGAKRAGDQSLEGRSRQSDRTASKNAASKDAHVKQTGAKEAGAKDKDDVSWREILDATDGAEPLDLASASGPASDETAENAMRIIADLQAFTLNLETRLYGEPPPALQERFARGDRNVFANRILRLNEADVKRRIRMESGRDRRFEGEIHLFLQGFERLLEDATTSETADEDLEEYLSSPLGRVYLLIGATVGYFA